MAKKQSAMRRNANVFFLAVGIVLVWRGIWGLADMYLLPHNPTLSLLLSVFIGLLMLYWNDRKINELV